MSSTASWTLRRALPPPWRRRVRSVVDATVGGVLGSWRATGAPDAVSLTFDDGPDPAVTPQLLDVLDEIEAPSTFFVLLNQCVRYPDLAREIAARGHEVALHGRDHSRITDMSSTAAYRYLSEARDELERLVEQPVLLYRPPYGAQSLGSYVAARRASLSVVVWSADAEDWVDASLEDVVSRAAGRLRPGRVLLLHERLEPDPLRGSPETTFDRPRMIAGIGAVCRSRGLRMETVGALAAAHGVINTAWFRP